MIWELLWKNKANKKNEEVWKGLIQMTFGKNYHKVTLKPNTRPLLVKKFESGVYLHNFSKEKENFDQIGRPLIIQARKLEIQTNPTLSLLPPERTAVFCWISYNYTTDGCTDHIPVNVWSHKTGTRTKILHQSIANRSLYQNSDLC